MEHVDPDINTLKGGFRKKSQMSNYKFHFIVCANCYSAMTKMPERKKQCRVYFGSVSEGFQFVMVEKAGWGVSDHSSRSVGQGIEKQSAGWHGAQ